MTTLAINRNDLIGVICPGFSSNADLFLSYTYLNINCKNETKLTIHIINYYACGLWCLFDFYYNRFWFGKASSGVYGSLIQQLIDDEITTRLTNSIQGPMITLFNKRDLPACNIVLNKEQINKLKQTEILFEDDNENELTMWNTKTFSHVLLDILVKNNYEIIETKQELINLFANFINKRLSIAENTRQ